MRDYLEIGSSPVDEDCAQVGSDDYYEKSRLECKVFARQLIRVFGNPPAGASIGIKSFQHDFGTYREVCVFYEDTDEEAREYAFNIEGNTPEKWDKKALHELADKLRQLARRDIPELRKSA